GSSLFSVGFFAGSGRDSGFVIGRGVLPLAAEPRHRGARNAQESRAPRVRTKRGATRGSSGWPLVAREVDAAVEAIAAGGTRRGAARASSPPAASTGAGRRTTGRRGRADRRGTGRARRATRGRGRRAGRAPRTAAAAPRRRSPA